MDVKTLRTQTSEALVRSLAESERALHDLRFQIASHQLKSVRTVRELRRDIARLRLTIGEKN